MQAMDTQQRTEQLDRAVQQSIMQGWVVESRTAHQVVMTSGRVPNHVVHGFLTLFTCGLWAAFWLLDVLLANRLRIVGWVAEDGHVRWSEPVNY